MKYQLMAVSIFSLAIAIVIGSWFVSKELNRNVQVVMDKGVDEEITQEKQLLTQSELGSYLGVTDEELQMILPRIDENITTSSIPYIKIGTEFYFPVKAIDKWLLETEAIMFSR
ncbi:hypothetical protein [Rossellomorea aquimaris]|uniref:hypothetical protein n=1 Tax=Rossellomorea aquimaris TaxID=189382 RepID=UPI0007D087D5|nr:hypothetical protein [Rossellomorea aquimaris]